MTKMSKRQCEIAAESYAAHLLARSGYDVLVQYGFGQPQYDLVAVKPKSGGEHRKLLVSVKGGQTGGWMLATKKHTDRDYKVSIDRWRRKQSHEIVFILVEFRDVKIGEAPRVYVARTKEIARHLKRQSNGVGWGALREDHRRFHPRAKISDKVPNEWVFSQRRIDTI